MEIEIARDGAEVRASARAGSVTGQPATHLLGPELGPRALLACADGVRAAADKGAPLDAPLLARAETIHRALFQGGIEAVRRALQPSSGEPLLVRLRIRDAELRKVPWEAIAAPGQVRGFVGTAADLLLARAPEGDTSEERRPLREVREALRVLVVAPDSPGTLIQLRAALKERIEAGEVVVDAREDLAAEPRRLLEAPAPSRRCSTSAPGRPGCSTSVGASSSSRRRLPCRGRAPLIPRSPRSCKDPWQS